jgi:exopolyphosphatase/guanosine-5'-triphosphate,3'-diphosphate pyrophosphatase
MLASTAMDMRSIAHWVAGRLESIGHEQRVCRIASTIFDLTREHHDLSFGARNLLRGGALVHDVGRCVEEARHPEIGARMIARDRALNVSDADRRALAFLTLYHRGGLPEYGDERVLVARDDRTELRRVLALLRAADALDSRSQEVPRLVFAMKRKRLKVACYLSDVEGKAARVYQRRKKFRLMEEEFGCEVEVEIREMRQRERAVA